MVSSNTLKTSVWLMYLTSYPSTVYFRWLMPLVLGEFDFVLLRLRNICGSDNYHSSCTWTSNRATMRFMVTGVPPQENVEDFIASKNTALKKFTRSLKKRVKKDDNKRAKKYRLSSDLPNDLKDLVQALTHYNPRKRATVRSVTRHPWIKSAPTCSSRTECSESQHGGPIVYLQCGKWMKVKASLESQIVLSHNPVSGCTNNNVFASSIV